MKFGLFTKFATTAAAFGMLAGAAQAQIISQPGETMGIALGAPLPEGVFALDTESYGSRDNGGGAHLGVNIPVIVWSTPFSFYDTRLEFIAAVPFTHTDGPSGVAALNRVDVYSNLYGAIFAHDFGNGFNASILAGVRTEDNFTNAGRGTAADMRGSVSYVKNGWNATLTLAYSGNFGGVNKGFGNAGFDDNIYLDYTLTHKFDKLELGVVGFAVTDINQGYQPNAFGGQTVRRAVAVGGLIGYAFDKFTVQGIVTREVAGGPGGLDGYGLGGGLETRGWIRVIVPLYVAPAAPAPIRARY